jgi:hypothetical protein
MKYRNLLRAAGMMLMVSACGKALPEPGVRVETKTIVVPGLAPPAIYVSMTDVVDVGPQVQQEYVFSREGTVYFPLRAYSLSGTLNQGDTATLTIGGLNCDYQRANVGQETLFRGNCYGDGDVAMPKLVPNGGVIRFYVQNSETAVTIDFVVE